MEGVEAIFGLCKKRQRVLDFGCGNGRLFELFKGRNIAYTGIDQSGGLITHARMRHAEDVARGVAQFVEASGDMLPFCLNPPTGGEATKRSPARPQNESWLPFPDASFDCVFSDRGAPPCSFGGKREAVMRELRRVFLRREACW